MMKNDFVSCFLLGEDPGKIQEEKNRSLCTIFFYS